MQDPLSKVTSSSLLKQDPPAGPVVTCQVHDLAPNLGTSQLMDIALQSAGDFILEVSRKVKDGFLCFFKVHIGVYDRAGVVALGVCLWHLPAPQNGEFRGPCFTTVQGLVLLILWMGKERPRGLHLLSLQSVGNGSRV